MNMLQMLRANPAAMLQQAGYKIPTSIQGPQDILQYLLNSGQVSQDAYNRAQQMARRMMGK